MATFTTITTVQAEEHRVDAGIHFHTNDLTAWRGGDYGRNNETGKPQIAMLNAGITGVHVANKLPLANHLHYIQDFFVFLLADIHCPVSH